MLKDRIWELWWRMFPQASVPDEQIHAQDKRKNKLSVVVPYRDRQEHLEVFRPYMERFLTEAGYDFELLIVEQDDTKRFDRASLINVGVEEATGSYVSLHDVDMLPKEDVYQIPLDGPVHLCDRKSGNEYVPCAKMGGYWRRYYGGVNLFTKQQFETVGGMSWGFRGWGGEDDDLLKRVRKAGFPLWRRPGVYEELPHVKATPYSDEIHGLRKPQWSIAEVEVTESFRHFKVKFIR